MRTTFFPAVAPRGVWWLLGGLATSLVGCGGDDAREASAPAVPDLEPGWNRIEPGGDTTCARDTPFHFFARAGTVNKLAIVFDGGGACWNELTCGVADMIFSPEADESLDGQEDGISDRDHADNPLSDWHAVFIPYCTGDIHWGDSVTTYGSGDGEVTIHHKGAVNARAVLDWVYEHYERPETILVTGFSAGAYGSIGWAPDVMRQYEDTRVVQLGDCGAGVITDNFFEESFPSWNAEAALPTWIEGLDRPVGELTLEDLYIEVARAFPNNVVSQYTTYNDENQRFYYQAMGGDPSTWTAQMLAKLETIAEEAPSFRYYIAGGDLHVALPYPEFYTYEAEGVRLRDWVADLLAGEDVDNVRCTQCDEPELYMP